MTEDEQRMWILSISNEVENKRGDMLYVYTLKSKYCSAYMMTAVH